ncbi:hypothetical protein [Streptomyces sp. NPDC002402]
MEGEQSEAAEHVGEIGAEAVNSTGLAGFESFMLAIDGLGLLPDVDVHPIIGDEGRGEVLLTVRIAEAVALASAPVAWCEIAPRRGAEGASAALDVLRRLDEIVQQVRGGFVEYAWLRVASELSEIRKILAGSPTVADGQ